MSFHRIISSLLHPILFPLIGSIFYLLTIPRYISDKYKLLILSIIFLGTYLLPIMLLWLLKRLNMIQSFHLSTIEERKFPMLLLTFLGILIGRMLFKIAIVNDLATFIIAGSFALLLVYGFLWLRIKVSIHTLGVGGLIGFLMKLSMEYHQNSLLILAFLFVLFGVIANARIKLKAHTFWEVILGLIIGVATQLLVPLIYQNI